MRVARGTCAQARQMIVAYNRAVGIRGCADQLGYRDVHVTCGPFKGLAAHVVSFTHPEWRLSFNGRVVTIDAQGLVD
jgi:hypothetical protein